MVTRIKKCQSKKHSFGGCGDPKCPEGLSIQAALDTALKDKDIMAYIEARQLTDIKPSSLYIEKGIASLWISHTKATQRENLRYIAKRPEVLDYINSLDRTTLPSFETVEELEAHINDNYRPYADIQIRSYEGLGKKKNLTRLSVTNMHVDADLRGAGIGSYFRSLLTKHADEKGYLISGTPTNSGDGTIERTDENYEEYKTAALKHRARLEHFYLRNGYERNYGTQEVVFKKKDYWTGEVHESNSEWLDKFNDEGRKILFDAGAFIRWPNGVIPKELLQK